MEEIANDTLWVLNTNFQAVCIIDKFESMIWTDRYYDCGEVEIYTSPEDKLLTFAIKGHYIYKADSEHLMIIEEINIESDTELGNHLTVKGRSLESILDRRIVWNQTIFNGNFQNAVKKILEDAFINPEITARKISNFVFKESTDSYITSLKIDTQYTGDNVLEIVQNLCLEKNIGFKITLSDDYKFVFELYYGKNRSYDQTENPYVIFSPNFENIVNSNYIESNNLYKNVALVAGEDEAENRKTIVIGSESGLNRRELYVDARDIRMKDGDGNPISESDYNEMLRQRGNEYLKKDENSEVTAFEGEIEATKGFIYGRDFFMGDIVQIENEYGKQGVVRVTEYVTSWDSSGKKAYPTFKIVDEEDDTNG